MVNLTSYTTAQRLKQIMEMRNLRQIDILTAAKPYYKKYSVKLDKNTLSQYVSGKFAPRQDKLTILGLALNVSEVWLMGFDVPIERNTRLDHDEESGDQSNEFINLFSRLSAEKQKIIILAIKGLLTEK